MPYASLDEVYPGFIKNSSTKDNIYSDITNNIINYNKDTQYPENNIENFYDINEQKLDNIDNFNNEVESEAEDSDSDNEVDYQDENFEDLDKEYCNRFLYHLSICNSCREFIRKKFGVRRKIVQIARKNSKDEILDIALYIITGIFMLFLLDLFLKLGKYLGRN